MTPTERFFAFARERHAVYLWRAAGVPWPWTDDPILRKHRFTNVYRELDRTTAWFRRHVRDRLRDRPEVLPATVVFRWFNRISTGEAIFCQADVEGASAFDVFLRTGKVGVLRHAIVAGCGAGPYVTGAYTINTRSAGLGLSKLDGVLRLIEMWFEHHPHWRCYARAMMGYSYTLEAFCDWVQSPCLGSFMAYEVACDLRHTTLLGRAPDVMTWANPGPGAVRGLQRLAGIEKPTTSMPQAEALGRMRELLGLSRRPEYWPQMAIRSLRGGSSYVTDGYTIQGGNAPGDWPPWELREVEHVLCEADKHERVRLGQGRPRGRAPTC